MSEKRSRTAKPSIAALLPALRAAIARGNEARSKQLRQQATEAAQAAAAHHVRCAVWIDLELLKVVELVTARGERSVTLAPSRVAHDVIDGLPADPGDPILLALLRAVPGLTVEVVGVNDRRERALRLSWPNPELT